MTKDELFTFVHVTDTHFTRGEASDAMLRGFVDLVNSEQGFPLPDFIIHTGDIIRGYYDTLDEHVAQMRAAKEILDELRAPAFYTCHNHDTFGEDVRGAVFDEVFGVPHFQEIQRDGFYLPIFSGALCTSDLYGTTGENDTPPEWGFDIHCPAGLRLLRSVLGAHQAETILVFSHLGLVTPRQPPYAENSADPLPPRSGFGYCCSEAAAAPVRNLLEEHGVLAHYSGHSHVNSRVEVNNVQYISSSALRDYPGEIRLVRVYADRLEHETHQVPGGRNLRVRWRSICDAEHPTPERYYAGNPDERDFVLRVRGSLADQGSHHGGEFGQKVTKTTKAEDGHRND